MSVSPLVPNKIGENKYPFVSNVESGITAHAGSGQTNAYQLTAQMSLVSVVASASDSVKLPKIGVTPGVLGAVGTLMFLQNQDASDALKVYGSSPDTINAVATGTGNAVSAGVMVILVATSYNPTTGIGTWSMIDSTASAVAAFTSGTISGVTIESSPIGMSAPVSGQFTQLTATSAAVMKSLTVSAAITAATLQTTGAATLNSASVSGTLAVIGQSTMNAITVSAAITAATLQTTGAATLNSATVSGALAANGTGTLNGDNFLGATAGNLFGTHGVSGAVQASAIATVSTSAGVTGAVGFTATQAGLILTNINSLIAVVKGAGLTA